MVKVRRDNLILAMSAGRGLQMPMHHCAASKAVGRRSNVSGDLGQWGDRIEGR